MQHEHTRQRAFNCQIASAKARTLDHRNMKALTFKRYGGPDQLAFADIPKSQS